MDDNHVKVIRALYKAAACDPEYKGVERFCEELKIIRDTINNYLQEVEGDN